MDLINHDEFNELLKEASVICSPYYGQIICFNSENPFKKTPMALKEGCQTYFSKGEYGAILKILENDEVSLFAFVLK